MDRSRQLAAIMFTDIEGYTALMQQNEQKAIQARAKHRQIFNSITEKHHGRILQYYGDGTLSIFDSAIDAVNCGIEMQLGFQADPAIPVRIGIHTGDIIFSEEEIIGDGVNVASRIESLAVPGSVFISEKVFDEIKNQESIETSMLQTFKLKNVEKPVQVYAVSNTGLVVPHPEDIQGKTESDVTSSSRERKPIKHKKRKGLTLAIAITAIVTVLIWAYLQFGANSSLASATEENSIAVLAFENMSGDPDQEYFSDGISEEILNSLAHVQGLKIAGRTSAFSFKGKDEDIRTIGEKLDVKMVLEGSVRKAGNQVRITSQLINVEDGFHIWSETYDRNMEDIFAVQKDIADRIVEKLKLEIQETSEYGGGTQNMEAYESLLKGSYFFRRDYEDTKKALEYFQKAVALDPNYAEAYAFIGETYLHYAGFNLMSAADAYANARTAAQKALSLNEHEPRAHKVLAYIHLFYDWDWVATRSSYANAIRYGLPEENEFVTYYDVFVNKDYDHAIRVAEQVLKTDPLHMESHWQLGLCYFFAERLEEALASFNNALELDPNYSEGHNWKGVVLGYLGRYDEGIKSLEKALEITGGEGLATINLLVLKIQMGNKDEVLQILTSTEFIDPMDAAMLYTLLEMPDDAISWIEKGYRERSVMMVSLKHHWIWDPIRDDPRFIEIYHRMKFSD
ncbi:MAG: tetratricopeptide repeat protein [Saprospiraceae bacterium]|nr:tetratricopeptide repeat protein [Saprospiraceae bacterium]